VLGTYLAALAGALVVGNPNLGWRWGFVIGAVPAVLTIWIRWSLREPEQWKQARQRAQENAAERPGRLLDLFSRTLVRRSLVGLFLATVGLATFWGVHIYGRELLRSIVERPYLHEHASRIDAHVQSMRVVVVELTRDEGVNELAVSQIKKAFDEVSPDHRETLLAALPEGLAALPREEVKALPSRVGKQMRKAILQGVSAEDKRSFKNWEMLGMFLVTTGGGLGLLSFGPICERIGRRATFLFFHLGGLVTALVVFQFMADVSANALCWMLPLFGYMTLGMHAGYAIYFPELFPTRLRGTGGGFCFNGGRFLAASILMVRGWMRSEDGLGLSLETTASLLSLLFLVGVIVLLAAPETRGRELPE
jgi:MFS family permease